MSNFGDDYFHDVTSNITEEDRIKAGYKIPVRSSNNNNGIGHISQPKALGVDALRGDLSNIAIPVPINFHEGGIFANAADRLSFSKPINQTDDQMDTQTDKIVSNIADNKQSTQEVSKSETSTQLITDNIDDHQLNVSISNNPYNHAVMIKRQEGLQKVTIGENQMILGRGPNNEYGRPGFYAGLFESKRFGNFPTQAITYDPNNVNNIDEHGYYIDSIEQQKTLQLTPEQIDKNKKALMASDVKTIEHSEEKTPMTIDLGEPSVKTSSHVLLDPPKLKDQSSTSQTSPTLPSNDIQKLTDKIVDLEKIITQLVHTVENQTQIINDQTKTINMIKQMINQTSSVCNIV